jgi:hypothetical protein
MPQLIVDPNNRGVPVGQKSIAQLRPKTRRFGFVPNLALCQPGDLVLFSSVSPDWTDRLISGAQDRAGFAEDDSRWTHAAVYLYEDFIVEADLWGGVRSRSLYTDVPECCFRVRRRPDLDLEDRYKIALCAQRMLGARYGFRSAFSLGLRTWMSAMWNRP